MMGEKGSLQEEHLRVGVTNLGPIMSAEISVAPLTVLVGQNNVGKSYLATLLYAILPHQHAKYGRMRPIGPDVPTLALGISPSHISGTVKKDLSDVFRAARGRSMQFANLSDEAKSFVHKSSSAAISRYFDRLGPEIERCFGTALPDLVPTRTKAGPLEIQIRAPQGAWERGLRYSRNKLRVQATTEQIRFADFTIDDPFENLESMGLKPRAFSDEEQDYLMYSLLAQAAAHAWSRIPLKAFFLPAARSGILQARKAIAGSLISFSSFVGITEGPLSLPEIPRLSGTVTDFIVNLLYLGELRKPYKPLVHVANMLEKEVLNGTISIRDQRPQFPEIIYSTAKHDFEFHQTSSMVSEIAPVVLFLKHIVRRGNLLIFEEPESHLHPANQRLVAKAIVRAVNAGLKVLVTTHSDFLLQQISNCVMASRLSARQLQRAGLTPDDVLRASQVAVHLLRPTPSGSTSEPIEVSERDGISDEAFAEVTLQLYEQMTRMGNR